MSQKKKDCSKDDSSKGFLPLRFEQLSSSVPRRSFTSKEKHATEKENEIWQEEKGGTGGKERGGEFGRNVCSV
ncbi:hypothetical protein K0M31_019686 [Melipona bicolor]|uniref:Uncharacterized protein n=1 Tax=Melipona bicolor TaxID=60889 RepID=A0AA40G2W5_9HYME|nr:hypothetical protein K0M31_019686 [Melipona bicolor]